jgi:hypothetical protein
MMGTETKDTRDPIDAHNDMAEKFYEKTPLSPTPGRFYTYSVAGAAIDGRQQDMHTVAGMSPAAIQEQRDTFAAIEKETGLPDVFVGVLAGATMDAILASTRIPDDADADEIKLIKQIEDGNRESRERLSTLYGNAEAADLTARAHRFVKSNAKLARIFKDHNLGSRPDVVMPLVDFVRRTGWGRQTSR